MVISTEGQTSPIEIDINQVYEDLNIKANTSLSNVDSNIDYVVESYNDGTNWYRKYKSGWLEQGGLIDSSVSDGSTVNLLKPFKDTNYTFSLGVKQKTASYGRRYEPSTTTTFKAYWISTTSSITYWEAKGQGV